MKSFRDHAADVKASGPHEHACPSCGVIWEHESEACDRREIRVCPTLDCLDEYLREKFPDVDRTGPLTAADIVAFEKRMRAARG